MDRAIPRINPAPGLVLCFPGIIPCVIFQACLEKALESDENEVEMRNRQNQELKLKSPTIKTLELLLQVLDYMYRHDLKFVEDYRY